MIAIPQANEFLLKKHRTYVCSTTIELDISFIPTIYSTTHHILWLYFLNRIKRFTLSISKALVLSSKTHNHGLPRTPFRSQSPSSQSVWLHSPEPWIGVFCYIPKDLERNRYLLDPLYLTYLHLKFVLILIFFICDLMGKKSEILKYKTTTKFYLKKWLKSTHTMPNWVRKISPNHSTSTRFTALLIISEEWLSNQLELKIK